MQISAYTFHNKIMVGDMIQTGDQNGSDHSHFLYPDRETTAAACIVFLIQEKIVNMKIKIMNMKNLCYECAWTKDNGISIRNESALCKLYCAQAANEVIDDALQIMGGLGYTIDCRISRLWRDARNYRIGGGTDEIMIHIAGRGLLKEAQ